VFCNEDGSYLKSDTCRKVIDAAAKAAGLRTIGWHTLRHTFASHLVMRRVPLAAVQKLLGHASIKTTMRYAHLSPSVTENAVSVLDGEGAQEGHKEDRRDAAVYAAQPLCELLTLDVAHSEGVIIPCDCGCPFAEGGEINRLARAAWSDGPATRPEVGP